MLVILRAYRSRHSQNTSVGGMNSAAIAGASSRRPAEWCGKDSTLCIIEEWIHSPY